MKASGLRAAMIAATVAALTVIPTTTAAAEPVTGTVAGTEGLTLFVRSGPGTGYGVVGQLDEGASVTIDCQVTGTDVDGNAVWNHLPELGGYASDFYLDTPGYDGRHPSLPECEDSTGDLRDRIVNLAWGELGNTDKSKYGAPADHDWCQYFVNWVWRNAGVTDMNDTHFTGDFYHWGKDRGLTRDGWENIQVGDAVLFGTGPNQWDTGRHVGIVVETHADGSFTTIDGNYSDAVTKVGPTYPWDASPPEPENVYAVVSPPAL
jgi:hypothetical protein